MQTTSKNLKDFQEIPGESIMDRRVRYWRWRRAKGDKKSLGPGDLGRKPSIKQLMDIVDALQVRLEALECRAS